MNQNTNNQQNSNEVRDAFLVWLDMVIKFSKESIFMGGECDDMQIRLMEQIRHKYVSLNSELNTINEPIKDEELIHQFSKIFTNVLRDYIFVSEYKKRAYEYGQDCAKIAKQYAASKLNNTIEDKWISVENKLPEPGYEYLCYDDENDNCDVWYYDEDGFGYLGDTKKPVTHWQYLPKAPNQ